MKNFEMKKLSNILKSGSVLALIGLLAVGTAFTGCRDEVGCTNRTADNYNPDAIRDDGSCVSARDKFLGVYSLLHIQWNGNVRDSFPDAEDPTLRYMTIAEDDLREPKDDVKMLNFGKDSLTVRALINKNFLRIPQQSLNAGGVSKTFVGEGHIDDSGYLTILYSTTLMNGQYDCRDCVIFAQRTDN
jgi:hypothetical protein